MNTKEVEISPLSSEIRQLSDDELGNVDGGKEQGVVMCTLIFPGCIIAVAASADGYATQRTNIW